MLAAATFAGDIWSKLEFDLSELRDLFAMAQETKEWAKGRKLEGGSDWQDTAPRWADEEAGVSVRPWLMIPHVDAVDREAVRERLEAGRTLLASVEKRMAARQLTPELIREWGLLNQWAGALLIVYQMRPDARQLRAGDDNLEAHKRWFAHYYLSIQPRLKRDEALERMERLVNSIIQVLPNGPEREWFSKFVGTAKSDSIESARRLTKTFREKLTLPTMKQLSVEPLDVVPEFALVYPAP